MWFKAKFFLDDETADKILATTDPEEARKLGRLVKNYVHSAWDRERTYFMMKAVSAKFLQNKNLRKKLIDPKYDGIIGIDDQVLVSENASHYLTKMYFKDAQDPVLYGEAETFDPSLFAGKND